jgi:hypothetical protein
MGRPLEYAPPPSRQRRPFLARPFWRDYFLAYLCIGAGAMLGDAGAPARDFEKIALLTVAAVFGGAGVIIWCCAMGYSVWSVVRRRDEDA